MTKKLIGVVTLFVIILNACSYPSAYKWKLSSQSNTQWISEDGTIVLSVNENHSVTGIMEVNGEVIEI